MIDMYMLDWQGTKPPAATVTSWLAERGFVVESVTVYNNGTIMVSCEPDPTEAWRSFPGDATLTQSQKLEAAVMALVNARAELLAIPENQLTREQRAILALMALVLTGYGVTL